MKLKTLPLILLLMLMASPIWADTVYFSETWSDGNSTGWSINMNPDEDSADSTEISFDIRRGHGWHIQ